MAQAHWTEEMQALGAIAPRKSLAEIAADTLREFILLGKLKAGLPVRERDLAEALGISRTPLKEALRILENEGLIVYEPTRRPRVADPTLEELTQNLAVLGVLEALAGELACDQATDGEIAQASELCNRMMRAPEGTDPLEFFGWDMEFHQTIVRAARNAPLLETHKRFNARLWRARFISSKLRTGRDSTLGEHENIVEALTRRDARDTARHMRCHLDTTVSNIAKTQEMVNSKAKADGIDGG